MLTKSASPCGDLRSNGISFIYPQAAQRESSWQHLPLSILIEHLLHRLPLPPYCLNFLLAPWLDSRGKRLRLHQSTFSQLSRVRSDGLTVLVKRFLKVERPQQARVANEERALSDVGSLTKPSTSTEEKVVAPAGIRIVR